MKSQLNCLALLLVGLLQHIAGAQTNARFQTRPAASRSAAESSTASATSVSADLLAIYQKTKTANNESTITSLARGCAQIVADTQRSRVDRDYAANLLAWGLNRRGEMRNERAAELVAAGQLAEANQLDQQAAKDFETSIEYGPANWRTHHNFAISLAMKGDYPRAIKEFTAAIELKPDYANSHFNRGELYFELEQYSLALGDYSRALEVNDRDPQYYNSRGHCQFMLEAYEPGIADYRQAAELAQDSAVYYTDLADACQYCGRWEEAATAYRAAVAIDNQYSRAYQNASWLMATCPDAKVRNVELGLSAAKKSLELEEVRSARGLDTLAAATAAMGKIREAVSLQREALQLASADEQPEMAQRLRLYEAGKAYFQPTSASNIASRGGAKNGPIRSASGSVTVSR